MTTQQEKKACATIMGLRFQGGDLIMLRKTSTTGKWSIPMMLMEKKYTQLDCIYMMLNDLKVGKNWDMKAVAPIVDISAGEMRYIVYDVLYTGIVDFNSPTEKDPIDKRWIHPTTYSLNDLTYITKLLLESMRNGTIYL